MGYTTKFLPGLANKLSDNGHTVKGISASSPLISAYNNIKGSYVFAVNNHMISKSKLIEQERLIEFLPVITKAKEEGAGDDIKKLLKILLGKKKQYKPINVLDIMEKCIAYHKACLKAEYTRTVFMNNPKFQMVTGITKTKLEVIDLDFSQNPFKTKLFAEDVTKDYVKLLEKGVKVLFTNGEYSIFTPWHGTLQAITNFDWKHNSLFRNEIPNKLKYGFAKGAHNLGFIKYDGAGHLVSETHSKELVDAIYENLVNDDKESEEDNQLKMVHE